MPFRMQEEVEPFNVRFMGFGSKGCCAINKYKDSIIDNIEAKTVNVNVTIIKRFEKNFHLLFDCIYKEKDTNYKTVDNENNPDLFFAVSWINDAYNNEELLDILEKNTQPECLKIAIIIIPHNYIIKNKEQIVNFTDCMDTVILYESDKIVYSENELSEKNNIKSINHIIKMTIDRILDSVNLPGMIGFDFADLKTIFKKGKFAKVGFGKAPLIANRSKVATGMAIEHDITTELISCDKPRYYLNIATGRDYTMHDMMEAQQSVNNTQKDPEDVDIVISHSIHENLEGGVDITLMSTGYTLP